MQLALLFGAIFSARRRAKDSRFELWWQSKRISHDFNYARYSNLQILLPNSVLDTLIRLNIQYPMLFKLSSLDPEFQRVTHAGVLEFLAEEGKAYLPSWVSER